MSMYSFIGFMAVIILATILACGYAIFKRIDEIDKKWKPSEEQMRALKNSAYGVYQNGDGPALRELCEQLQKLM